MTAAEYVQQNHKQLLQIVKNITKGHALTDDLYQEAVVILLTYPDQPKLQGMVDRGELRFFFVRIIWNQWNSKTSPFHYKYRKNPTEPIFHNFANGDFELKTELSKPVNDDWSQSLSTPPPSFDEDNTTDTFDIATLHKYIESEKREHERQGRFPLDAELLSLYLELGSLREVSDSTGIPFTTIGNSVRMSKSRMKELFQRGEL